MPLVERITFQQYSSGTDFSRAYADLLSIGGRVNDVSSFDAREPDFIADSASVRLFVKWTPEMKKILETDRTATHFTFRGQRHKITQTNRMNNGTVEVVGEIME